MGVKWEEMTPRERDALVAEKVMDQRVLRYQDGTLVGTIYQHQRCDKMPFYTTDISAAWQVVEHLRADGRGLRLRLNTYDDPGDPVWAKFYFIGEWEATAPTAPEAICLAALKAEGVEIE